MKTAFWQIAWKSSNYINFNVFNHFLKKYILCLPICFFTFEFVAYINDLFQ